MLQCPVHFVHDLSYMKILVLAIVFVVVVRLFVGEFEDVAQSCLVSL